MTCQSPNRGGQSARAGSLNDPSELWNAASEENFCIYLAKAAENACSDICLEPKIVSFLFYLFSIDLTEKIKTQKWWVGGTNHAVTVLNHNKNRNEIPVKTFMAWHWSEDMAQRKVSEYRFPAAKSSKTWFRGRSFNLNGKLKHQ